MAEIFAVVGTRAELIKLWPLLLEIDKRADLKVFATGQHNLDGYARLLDLPFDIDYLFDPPSASSRFFGSGLKALAFSSKLFFKLRSRLKRDLTTVVHGDTLSSAVTALSLYGRNRVVHVEAGLRSFSMKEPFPEEMARRIVDHRSNLLFPAGKIAEINLLMEEVPGIIADRGNTIIDSFFMALELSRSKITDNGYAVVTLHRHENLKDGERLRKVVEILEMVSKDFDIYFFAHDNTIQALKKYNLLEKLSSYVLLQRLVPYPEFIGYLAGATLILTDGGSIQEEAGIMKKPCILLRKRTERLELLYEGASFLSMLDIDATRHYYSWLKERDFKLPPFKFPYGRRGVSKKFAKRIISFEEGS